jgi:putative addiction module killer protein
MMTLKPLLKISFLKISNGKVPFLDWLEGLDQEIQLRVRNRIVRIEMGNFGDSKSIGQGVYELRFQINSGYRVYFGKEGSKIVILLNGGNKNTQSKDIKKAQEYWVHYLQGEDYGA